MRVATLGHALRAVTEEMGTNLYQSARSTVIREVRDMTTGLLDHEGRFIVGSTFTPFLMGAIEPAAREMVDEYDISSLEPGEAIVVNDPFRGGQHLNDVFLFLPIHVGGRVIAMACAAAHHPELGGIGTSGPPATDVFQEGVVIPPLRIQVDPDWRNGTFARLLLSNVRAPEVVRVDFEAQIAACHTGVQRVTELAARYGADELFEFYDHVTDYSRSLVEAAIETIPDGVYRSSAEVESDGVGGGPFTVRVAVTVDGRTMAIDFDGTDQQAKGYINAPWGSTVSSVRGTVMSILQCAHGLVNSGAFAPITIKAPAGTLVNPSRPAPTRARTQVSLRMMEVISSALSEVLPERIPAPGYNCQTSAVFAQRSADGYTILSEILGGGWGASACCDGASGMGALIVNAMNTPIEAVEAEFPYLRVAGYGLVEGSGGAGAMRGGEGLERIYDVLQPDVDFVHISERYQQGAPGLNGGGPGAPGSCALIRDGEVTDLGSKGAHRLTPGDRVVMRTGGGGGFGKETAE